MFIKISHVFKRISNQTYKPLFLRNKLSILKLTRNIFLVSGLYWSQNLSNKIQNQEQIKIINPYLLESQLRSETILSKVTGVFHRLFRFLQLIFIFSPSVLLLPLKLFSATQEIWLNTFVQGVQRAGVVWIKTFQYLSHRRDIIGDKMADKFVHLREQAPQHQMFDTTKSIYKQFGKNIKDIFDEFDQTPIASGSVSQVYRAIYKGQKVAVKVRHPNVQKNIQMDIDILFFMSKTLSLFSTIFQIPVNKSSLKKTLIDQIDFSIEANNLIIFKQMFKNNDIVHFPTTIKQGTKESVLVQSFVQGAPITYYEHHKHIMNKAIARAGAIAFFEMLMVNNFIHADCHGGNILVNITQIPYTFIQRIKDDFYTIFRYCENFIVKRSRQSPIFKQLYLEFREEEDEIRKLQRMTNTKVNITLIDAGMTLRLESADKANFVSFLKHIILKEPEECAQMIYSLSLYRGQKIIERNGKQFEKYFFQLKRLFKELTDLNLKDLQGLVLLKGMLQIIRDNGMKLQGQFATLLTNMLILQQIAKDLNPDVNIMKSAVPYFSK